MVGTEPRDARCLFTASLEAKRALWWGQLGRGNVLRRDVAVTRVRWRVADTTPGRRYAAGARPGLVPHTPTWPQALRASEPVPFTCGGRG